jgi:chromosome segregation ATPase
MKNISSAHQILIILRRMNIPSEQLDILLGIHLTHMILTHERDTLRAENNELKLNKGCRNERANLVVTHETDNLSSELEEVQRKFDELNKKYCAMKQNLHAMRHERDSLQGDKEKLEILEGRMKVALEEKSSIQKAHFVTLQERNTLRSERDELENKLENILL